MRIWCVPSATELENSPKLPPRINRDVYLRSPPPPPRLSFLNARCQNKQTGYVFSFFLIFLNLRDFKSFLYEELRLGKIVKFETKRDDAT